eukprot:scaffold7291_cov156-Chaetoceros_neogracile.AAC.2
MSGPDYQHYFNYYNDNRVTDFTFDGYQATTNNPGSPALHPIYRKFLSLFLNIRDDDSCGGSISSISDSSTQAGNGDYRDGDDEEEQKGAVGTNSKIGMDHDDSTAITTTSSTSNRYQDGGSLSKSKTSVDQIRGKPVREKPMVLITTRNGKEPCSKEQGTHEGHIESTNSAASEGLLDFGNSAFYLTKMNYDEGRPSTDDGTKTDSIGE